MQQVRGHGVDIQHIPMPKPGQMMQYTVGNLFIIASIDDGVLHVSVSRPDRDPTWDEIKRVRYMFWPAEAEVAMFLPPVSEYVNLHDHCFHLWGDPEGKRRWQLEEGV